MNAVKERVIMTTKKIKKVVDVSEIINDCMIEDILHPITDKNGIENIFAEIERAGNTLEKRLGKDRLDKLMENIKNDQD